jgi:hypothetical protein
MSNHCDRTRPNRTGVNSVHLSRVSTVRHNSILHVGVAPLYEAAKSGRTTSATGTERRELAYSHIAILTWAVVLSTWSLRGCCTSLELDKRKEAVWQLALETN